MALAALALAFGQDALIENGVVVVLLVADETGPSPAAELPCLELSQTAFGSGRAPVRQLAVEPSSFGGLGGLRLISSALSSSARFAGSLLADALGLSNRFASRPLFGASFGSRPRCLREAGRQHEQRQHVGIAR